MKDKHKLILSIANIRFEICSSIPLDELGLTDRMQSFVADPKQYLLNVKIQWKNTNPDKGYSGSLIYDPGSIWKLYFDQERYFASIIYNGIHSKLEGKVFASKKWNDIIIYEQPLGENWTSLLNFGIGELIFRTNVLKTDGIVFHSAGIDIKGKGVVFVGHSNEGKSTQLDLWSKEANVIAMNDDRIAVRVEKYGPVCYGSPWGGTSNVALNHSAPLTALILIGKSEKNSIRRVMPNEAAPLLLARAFLPYWDAFMLERAVENLERLLQLVPVYYLECQVNPSIIPLVCEYLCI